MDMQRSVPVQTPHHFHIPVMGTGFTIDTPLKVACYGIDSCVSLVDDGLIEQLRRFHCRKSDELYEEIPHSHPDHRALRITAYLNLLNKLVNRQFEELRASPFVSGSEITRYFELLPEGKMKSAYLEMLDCTDLVGRERLANVLRARLVVGKIDVNIMTKLDVASQRKSVPHEPEYTSAMSALRGFANSSLDASIVFSAGLNQRLYEYAGKFADFFPDSKGHLKKRIILKVSDFRSALIQGRFLAKHGLWVSEFRIESGINCGGHAFYSRATLLGNVLRELKERREELLEKLISTWQKAFVSQERDLPSIVPVQRYTVQGGVLTGDEQKYLIEEFDLDAVGWGTPFLLVPEAVNVDAEHLELLQNAGARDVCLSQSSPLDVPFWNLRQSASERARRSRIKSGKPGSPCPKGLCALSTEFGEKSLCTSSREYQKQKLAQLKSTELSRWLRLGSINMVMAKSCICHDLGGGVQRLLGINPKALPAICCGPSIAYFNQVATLQEMVSHIYGQTTLLKSNPRLHLFTRELLLYIKAFGLDVLRLKQGQWLGKPVELEKIKANLLHQIECYRHTLEASAWLNKDRYLQEVDSALKHLNDIPLARTIKAYLGRQVSVDVPS